MATARRDLRSLMVGRSTLTQGIRLAQASSTAARYTTTATGAAGTITCTSVTVTANTLRGKLVELMSGDLEGHRAIVTAQTAGGTINTTAFDAAVGNGVQFRFLDNPLATFVATSQKASGTTLTDSGRSNTYEADDYWNGDFAEFIYSADVTNGVCREITDYTGSSGEAIIGTTGAGATIAVGDMAIIHRPLACEDPSFTPGTVVMDRPAVRDTFSPLGVVVAGRSEGELSFSMPVKGDGTGAGDGVAWTRQSAVMPLLEACFGTMTADTGDACAAGWSTTTGDVADGTRFTEGMPIMINGEVTRITDISTNTLTVSPALSSTPRNGEVVYAAASFRRATSGFSPLSFTWYEDLVRYRLWSSLGTVSFSTDSNGRMMSAYSFMGQAHDHQATQQPVTLTGEHYPDTAVGDIIGNDCVVNINGTKYHCGSVSIDPGIVVAKRTSTGAVDGNLGPSVRGGMATATCNPLLEDASIMNAFFKESALEPVIFQFGNEPGNTFVVIFPKAQIVETVGVEDDEGELRQSVSLRAVQPGSSEPTQDDIICALL